MPSKLLIGGLGAAVAFLLATNPVVAEAAGSVTSGDIANNTIKSKDVKDSALQGIDVKDGSLESGDVADGSLTGSDVANGSLASADVTDGSLTGGDVADGSLGSSDVTDNSLTSGDVADGTITSGDVANGTLTHGDLTTGSVGIARGYAWNDTASPTIGVATPLTNGYTYNSTGGTITLTRSAAGTYDVTFTGLSWDPGTVQVTAYGSSPTWCNVGGWSSPSVTVRCYDAAGAPTDSRFTVAVFE